MQGVKLKKKRKRQLMERMADGEYIEAIAGVKNVECRLHKINLSSNYHYPELTQELGALHDISENSWMLRGYRQKFIRNFNQMFLNRFK